VQALDLSKAHARNRAMEMAHGACTTELESNNARLWSELEQACQALAEADAARSSLSMDWEKLERECMGLRTSINMLKQEKIQVLNDHEVAVTVE
jgi:hypothetical protein